MPQYCHTGGVVIRSSQGKDVILSLLTPELGKIPVICKGAKSVKGAQMALSQVFTYGDFELYRRGDFYWLHTGEIHSQFYGITKRLDALTLAAYFCEIASMVSEPGVPCPELVRLLLNMLYFLDQGTHPDDFLKGIFEWRILQMQGMAPALEECSGCGEHEAPDFSLEIAQGELLCGKCRAAISGDSARQNFPSTADTPIADRVLLSPAALAAIRFSVSTPLARMVSFRLGNEKDRICFAEAGEKFLRYHLDTERASETLQMYHKSEQRR